MLDISDRVLIFGSSGGLGKAFVSYCSNKVGVENVVSLSRSENGLDITDELNLESLAEKIKGPFRLIVNATGILKSQGSNPEKTIYVLEKKLMNELINVNAIGPALLLKFFSKKLDKERPSIFLNLSARVGSIEDNKLGGWISYRTSKAALNQIIKTASIEINRRNKNAICVGVHPGTVKTKFTENYQNRENILTVEKSVKMIMSVIENMNVSDNGKIFAYDGSVVPW